MELSNYPCESLSFSGLGASGETAAAAAEALAEGLNSWVSAHAGRRVLQVTPVAVQTGGDAALAALIVHTAGSELGGELAEQVAAAVDDAMEMASTEERNGQIRSGRNGER
ncbi:MAG: hypothetical protein AB7R89_17300 [Dehalococcoidia bacterium]